MESYMTRDRGLAFLKEKLNNANLVKHCLATEAFMRRLAERLGADPDDWGLVGLMHDVDLGEVGADMNRHADVGAAWLAEKGMKPVLCEAVRKHNAEGLGLERLTVLDFALSSAETLTGLIVAAALVMPDKKLSSVTSVNVLKRMKEKSFARGASRDIIKLCEKIGIPLEEFVSIGLTAMQGIAAELGL